MTRNPEFSLGDEFADQSELLYLFELSLSQLRIAGELKPIREDVEHMPDGLPVLTEDDIDGDKMGARTITVAAPAIAATHNNLAQHLEMSEIGDNLSFWHIPAYYYEQRDHNDPTNKSLEYVSEQVVFMMPKDKSSVYLEDVIHLQLFNLAGTSQIKVSRDRPLQNEFNSVCHAFDLVSKNNEEVLALTGNLETLTKREVAHLMLIVQAAGKARGC